MTDDQRFAALERRLKITQLIAVLLLAVQFVWLRAVSDRRAAVGPAMDDERVEALIAAIYHADHIRPKGPDDSPEVIPFDSAYLDWNRRVMERYRIATRRPKN